jgi:hypothetical protein
VYRRTWRAAASQEGCQFPADDKGKGKEISLLATFKRIADWGACGKTRVVLQNRRPDQERTKTWGHDVRVLLSTYGGRGDEPLVGLAVRLRALGAEVRVCAPPDWAERPADS